MKLLVITGTDTAVGKTVVGCLLAAWWRKKGRSVIPLKLFSSGSRADARALRAASGSALSLDETNPWHYPISLAPFVASRRAGSAVALQAVLSHINRHRKNAEVLLIEGAGGLLSPLGDGFATRELIVATRALPLVVARNRLGAINQVLLVMAALPPATAARAQVVMMEPRTPTLATRTNQEFFRERLGSKRVHSLPWLRDPRDLEKALRNRPMRRVIATLAQALE